MFDEIYAAEYKKLTSDIKCAVRQLVTENASKPSAYYSGIIAACATIAKYVRKSEKTLDDKLEQEAASFADYFNHEKQ